LKLIKCNISKKIFVKPVDNVSYQNRINFFVKHIVTHHLTGTHVSLVYAGKDLNEAGHLDKTELTLDSLTLGTS